MCHWMWWDSPTLDVNWRLHTLSQWPKSWKVIDGQNFKLTIKFEICRGTRFLHDALSIMWLGFCPSLSSLPCWLLEKSRSAEARSQAQEPLNLAKKSGEFQEVFQIKCYRFLSSVKYFNLGKAICSDSQWGWKT